MLENSSKMDTSNRIICNVLATYGRSILSFVFTLFTARWILTALGVVDFGLYGVVGSIMFFISLFNTTQNATVARFYAYTIGRRVRLNEEGRERERSFAMADVFNAALSIHIVLPAILISIGYYIGLYALGHWLNIPADRLYACKWVFRLSLLVLGVSVVSVPYSALLLAYQLISKLILFSLVQVFGTVVVAYYMLYSEGDRLIVYAALMLLLNLMVILLQIMYARRKFACCRLSISRMFNLVIMCEMLKYTSFKFVGDVAWGIRSYGGAFLVNIFFGPIANAAYSIANQLSGQAASLCNTLANAFSPAITTEEGAGHRKQMCIMAIRCCKFGSILLLMVAVPLVVEMDDWLLLWLRKPPEGCSVLCTSFLLMNVITYLTKGHQLAIQAHGNIYKWQSFDALFYIFSIVFALVFIWFKMGLIAIGIGFNIAMVLISACRLIFARRLVGLSCRMWSRTVLFPICFISGLSYVFAKLSATYISILIPRLIVASCVGAFSVVAFSYYLVLDSDERNGMQNKIMKLIKNER